MVNINRRLGTSCSGGHCSLCHYPLCLSIAGAQKYWLSSRRGLGKQWDLCLDSPSFWKGIELVIVSQHSRAHTMKVLHSRQRVKYKGQVHFLPLLLSFCQVLLFGYCHTGFPCPEFIAPNNMSTLC